jgi:hypothetical protein
LRPSYAVVFNEPKIKLKMSFLKIKFPVRVRCAAARKNVDIGQNGVMCCNFQWLESSRSIDGRGDPLDHTDGERGKKITRFANG